MIFHFFHHCFHCDSMRTILNPSSFTLAQQIFLWSAISLAVGPIFRSVLLSLLFVICFSAGKLIVQVFKPGSSSKKAYWNSVPVLWTAKILKTTFKYVRWGFYHVFGWQLPCQRSKPIPLFSPLLESKAFIHLVMRDFVQDWYHVISDNAQFTREANQLLQSLAENLLERSSKVDCHKLCEEIILIYKCHVHDYQMARQRFKQQPSYRRRIGETRLEYKKIRDISHAFKHEPGYHPAMRSPELEGLYVNMVVRQIFRIAVPDNILQCCPAQNILVEILSRNILIAFLDMAQDSHWIHEVLILILADPVDTFEFLGHNEEKFMEVHAELFSKVIGDDHGNDCKPSEDVCFSSRGYDDCANELEEDPVIFTLDGNDDNEDDISSVRLQSDGVSTSEANQIPPLVDSQNASELTFQSSESPTPINFIDQHFEVLNQDMSENHPAQSSSEVDAVTLPSSLRLHRSQSETGIHESGHFSPNPELSPPRRTSSFSALVRPAERNRFDSSEVDSASEALSDLEGALHQSPHSLFEEISVPSTEVAREHGAFNTYTLYVIETLAWYQTPNKSWVLQPLKVKRRYREFVTLQERLDEHPKYGRLMRTIKGPKRWHALPFRNLNDAMIGRRKRFLEDYLKTLIRNGDIGNSLALRDFLAYEGDANIAFVRKANEVPRLDKILLKTVSGVFKQLSQGLEPPAHSTIEGLTGNSESRASIDSAATFEVDTDHDAIHLIFSTPDAKCVSDLEKCIRRCVSEKGVTTAKASFDHVVDEDNEFMDTIEGSYESNLSQQQVGVIDNEDRGAACSTLPITDAILDLGVQAFKHGDSLIQRENALHTFKVLFGVAFERWIQNELDDLVTEARCSQYIRQLRDTLWPDGHLDSSQKNVPTAEEREHTKARAVKDLKDFFPGFLRVLLGAHEFDAAIEEAVSTLDFKKINRHLLFCLLDHLLVTLFPEISPPWIESQLTNALDARHSALL